MNTPENNNPESFESMDKQPDADTPVNDTAGMANQSEPQSVGAANEDEIKMQQQRILEAQNSVKDKPSMQIKLPGSGAILTLGILSIATISCCGPFIGPILAIIALALTAKAMKLYNENPDMYKSSSRGNVKAGKICAIIGISIGGFMLIMWIVNYLTGSNNMQIDKIEEMYMQIWDNMNY